MNLDRDPCGAHLQRSRLAFLCGFYFLAPESLRRHAEAIRAHFRPTEVVRRRVDEMMRGVRATADVLVGVHVRHGDYRTYCGGIMFYTASEYADAMRAFARQFPDRRVTYIVCSDEPQPPDAFHGLAVTSGVGDEMTDLCLLAQCDYIIGVQSSFSRWASFWGNTPLWRLDWKAFPALGSVPLVQDFRVCYTASSIVDNA